MQYKGEQLPRFHPNSTEDLHSLKAVRLNFAMLFVLNVHCLMTKQTYMLKLPKQKISLLIALIKSIKL